MENLDHNLPDRYYSPDREFMLEYENTDAALPWRSHARLWIGRRSFLIPALLADVPVWDDADESWYAPAWIVGHRQKIARIHPDMRRIFLSEADFEPFRLHFTAKGFLLHFPETGHTPLPVNKDDVQWSKGRRF